MQDPRSIVITGASSGLGAALAVAYAKPRVQLTLLGRNAERLAAVAEQCKQRGSQVITETIDVTDRQHLRQYLLERDEITPFDLIIANAGISNAGQKLSEQSERQVFAVNLDGVLNTIYPLLPQLQQRRRGQIVIMSSLAAMVSIGQAPAYCASKAAVKTYGEALRKRLRRQEIEVTVICPGFVQTPLLEKNDFPMPLLMSVEKASEIMVRKIAKGYGLVAFPWRMYSFLWLLRLLPFKLIERLTRQV